MENIFIDVLPPWVETGLQPAFYDLESGTVLQQTARMYAKVRELTEGFNTFTENVTNEITTFEQSVNDTVNDYIERFNALYTYVHDYFDNLDVQEEVNHKLDEMAEDGSLDDIVARLIKEFVVDELNIREDFRIVDDFTDLYGGVAHNALQGFCMVGDHIVACLRDGYNTDNYVKLCEIDPSTKTILRYSYLELNHGNSITYDSTNALLYVASNSKVEGGSLVPDNSIKVVQYGNFTLQGTINVSNLPDGKRIRNVYYDNDNNILYAGDNYDVFIVDPTEEEITDSISLDVVSDDPYNTNQTIKRWNNMFVGVFMGFFAFWKLDGELVRVINLNQIQGGVKLGEPEDFVIKDNGDVILGTSKRLANYRRQRDNIFYKTNFWKNNETTFIPYVSKNDDRMTVVYVDNTSVADIEDGTSNYPYKDIQEAVNIARNTDDFLSIHVGGTTYDYISIVGVSKLNLTFESNVTIDGMTIESSNVLIDSGGNHDITINGIGVVRSKVSLQGRENHLITLNYFSNSALESNVLSYRNGIGLYSVGSEVMCKFCSILGNSVDSSHLEGTTARFLQCVFNGFDEHYAINISNNSNVYLARNTFGGYTLSATQHLFRVVEGSILHTQQNITTKYAYITGYNGRVYGVAVQDETFTTDVYIGDVTTVDTEYDMIRLKVKIGGLNSCYKFVDIPTSLTNDYLIETSWSNATAFNFNSMICKIDSGTLKVKEHYRSPINTTTYNRESITETPDTTTPYSCICGIEYYNL